jgi:hypothetical protein
MKLLSWLLTLALPMSCVSNANDTRFSVLILDTGLDLNDPYFKPFLCRSGHADLTGKGLQDRHGHGTNIAGLILRGIDPKRVCIKVVKYFNKNDTVEEREQVVSKIMDRLSELDYYMLNFSGNGTQPLPSEERNLKIALKRGAYVVVAAGNESLDLNKNCNSYPACYTSLSKFEGFQVVTDKDLQAANKGGPAKYNEIGRGQCYKDICLNGTSQATAVHTNRLLKSFGYGYNRR